MDYIVIAGLFLLAVGTGYAWYQAMFRGNYKNNLWILRFSTNTIHDVAVIAIGFLGLSMFFGSMGIIQLITKISGAEITELPNTPLGLAASIILLIGTVGGVFLFLLGWIWPFKLPAWLDPQARYEANQIKEDQRRAATQHRASTPVDPLDGPDARRFHPTGAAWGTPSTELPKVRSIITIWLPLVLVIAALSRLIPGAGQGKTIAAATLIFLLTVGFLMKYASQLKALPRAEELRDPRAEAYGRLSEAGKMYYQNLPEPPAVLLNQPERLSGTGLDPSSLALLSLSDEEAASVREETRAQARRTHLAAIALLVVALLGILLVLF
ncbi:MAG: hypothetical protein Q4P33_06790 [Flaviflexus sp.]|nr:hypothetical protein [Flaviflexus sp.]